MEKIIKKYRITESSKQEEDSLRYWKSKSIKAKIDAINQLRILYCELKNMDPNEQRLQRVFKITQLITNKKLSGRLQDLADVKTLLDTRKKKGNC